MENKVLDIAQELVSLACRKATDAGSEYPSADAYTAVCIAKKFMEDIAALYGILGEEKFHELSEALMAFQASKAIEEAEEFLKGDGEDG